MSTAWGKLSLWALGAALAAVGLASSAAEPNAEVAALHAVDDTWVKAFNSRDAATMAAQYDEHAVLLPPGAPAAHGRAAIQAFFAKMMPDATKEGLAFTLAETPAGGVHGNMGWASGSYVLKDKTGKVLDTGKYLSVSTKKDGKWLYVRDTWNSDGPPQVAEPAAAQKK